VPNAPFPAGRRSKRVALKKRASLIAKLGRHEERIPCLILDSSPDGFRLRATVSLKRGQTVEVVADGDPFDSVQCSVVWVGKPGTKHEGEVGLQTVTRPN
jgi:hypothetical protein